MSKTKSRGGRVLLVSVLAVSLGIYPGALALANESGDAGSSVGVTVGADVQVNSDRGDQEGLSNGAATTTADVSENNEDAQGADAENTHSGSATSTLHQENEQGNSDEQGNDENNNDENEIEVDHADALDATSTIDSPQRVHTHGELRSFLNHELQADEHVSDVTVSSTTVETDYGVPARLLWIIPTSLNANVSVASNGSVTITYPWYAFLFATQDDELRSQLAGAASTTLGSNINAGATLSSSAQAHLLNLVLSALDNEWR